MVIYACSTILSVLLAMLAGKLKSDLTGQEEADRRKRALFWVFCVLSILPLFLTAALRVNVGTDYDSYVYMMLHPVARIKEPVFDGLILLLQWLTAPPRVFFVISALWICAGYFFASYRYSAWPAYSICLFVVTEDFFVSMNVVRQYMAIAVLLAFFGAFRDQKWKPALIALVIAAMLHPSALIVVLLLALMRWVKVAPVRALITGVAVGVLGVVFMPLLRMLMQFTPYGEYFSNQYAESWYGPTIPMLAIYACILCVLSFCTDLEEARKDPSFRLLFHCVSMNYWLMALSLCMPSNFYRITYYFNAFFVIAFPCALKYMRTKRLRWIVGVGCIAAYTVWTVMLLSVGNQDALPYLSIFSEIG